MKKVAFLLVSASVAGFFAGMLWERWTGGPETRFHDMRVVHTADYVDLVEPDSPAVTLCVKDLGSFEAAYYFVRDSIRFHPNLPAGSPEQTLRDRAGSCLGKAALLASLYRAMGMPSSAVRVVTGEIAAGDALVEHAWVEIEHDGVCLQLDPTDLLARFDFRQFPGTSYTEAFVRKEGFCFNDVGFAVVSQLNRFRHGPPPWMRASR